VVAVGACAACQPLGQTEVPTGATHPPKVVETVQPKRQVIDVGAAVVCWRRRREEVGVAVRGRLVGLREPRGRLVGLREPRRRREGARGPRRRREGAREPRRRRVGARAALLVWVTLHGTVKVRVTWHVPGGRVGGGGRVGRTVRRGVGELVGVAVSNEQGIRLLTPLIGTRHIGMTTVLVGTAVGAFVWTGAQTEVVGAGVGVTITHGNRRSIPFTETRHMGISTVGVGAL